MSRNDGFSRRTFPIKAIVTYPYRKTDILKSPKRFNIAKKRMPAVGYVTFKFKEVEEQKKLKIHIGFSLCAPNCFDFFSKKLGQQRSKKNCYKTFSRKFASHQESYRIMPYGLDTVTGPSIFDLDNGWATFYEISHSSSFHFIPDNNRHYKVPYLLEKGISIIEIYFHFDCKLKSVMSPSISDIYGVTYYFEDTVRDQIIFYLNKCLNNYIKRRTRNHKLQLKDN